VNYAVFTRGSTILLALSNLLVGTVLATVGVGVFVERNFKNVWFEAKVELRCFFIF
jgi:hypothetical protein